MQRSRYLYFILIIWIVTVSRDVFCGDETNDTEDGDDDDTDDDDSKQSSSIEDFVGTNLFGNDGCTKKCFSTEDVALLAARKEFEVSSSVFGLCGLKPLLFATSSLLLICLEFFPFKFVNSKGRGLLNAVNAN